MHCRMAPDCSSGEPDVMEDAESVLVADELVVPREQDISVLTAAVSKLQEEIDVLKVSMQGVVGKEVRQVKVTMAETIDAVVNDKTSALQEDLRRLGAVVWELQESNNNQNQQSQEKQTLKPVAAQVLDQTSQRHSQSNASVLDWKLAEARMAEHKSYELRETIWDMSFFLGMKVMSPSDEFIVYCVLISNIIIQGLFIVLVELKMTDGDFNDDTIVQEYLDWRVMHAHNPVYADAITNTALADGVCTFNPIIMEGTSQAATYVNVHAYLAEVLGFSSGELLCMPANFLWVFACVKECENALRLLASLWSTVFFAGSPELAGIQRLLSARSAVVVKQVEEIVTVEDGDAASKSIKFSSSFRRASLITIFIVFPRLVILLMLGTVGARFLVANIELQEFILNSVALEVVLNVDELLFDIFVPAIPRMVLARTFPLHRSVALPKVAKALPYLKIAAVAAIVLLIRLLFLQPIITNIEGVERVMCGGDQDFLASELSIGSVFAGGAQTKVAHDRNKYDYLAILQRTALEEASRAGPNTLYLDSERTFPAKALFSIPNVVQARVYQSLTVGQLVDARVDEPYGVSCSVDRSWQSTDPSAQYPISKLLEDVFALPEPTCQTLKNKTYCYSRSQKGTVARFFCPHTCGLDEPQSGNAFEDPIDGVPITTCRMDVGNKLQAVKCEDLPKDHPSFSVMATSSSQITFNTFTVWWNASYVPQIMAAYHQLLSSGCEYLAQNPLLVSQHGACDPRQANAWGFVMRSMRFLCPVTCGCLTVAQRYKMDGKPWIPGIGAFTNCPKACFNYTL